jgi:hypothetical protein
LIKGYKPILELFNKKVAPPNGDPTKLDQGLLKRADIATPVLVNNLGTSKVDLNDLFAKLPNGKPAFNNEDQCSGTTQCKRPGFVVVV